ncbi:hypothetical protein [Nocardioides soli]|uniref:Uncharacterized protein n=1 Tax=Nocardioides soli TaxID=1036020 RepID=A0A7W4VSZ5_9ACTN|nr:hypothetical protein [Nocardioides soli]MBB3041227.1 hypothetical protein [Nocardioides soli]
MDYGYRSLALTITVAGDEAFALGVMQALARELLRPSNWLLFRLTPTTEPVWFKTYAGEPGDLSFDHVGSKLWRITVPLTAAAFAYGAAEIVGPFTVNNNPAAGSHACRYVIPTPIKGDAPSPCSVQIAPSVIWVDQTALFATVSHDGPAPAAHVWQTGSFTAGADTTHDNAAGSTFSGGSRSIVTFAGTPGLATRLSGVAPTSPEPGRYRVFLRAARSDTSTRFTARMTLRYIGSTVDVATNGVVAALDRPPFSANGYACLLDLGDFSIPLGGAGWDASDLPAGGTPPDIAVKLQRTTGTGAAWLDYLLLIPIDTVTTSQTRMMRSYFKSCDIQASRYGVWDAERELFRAMNTGDVFAGMITPQLSGGFPMLEPGKSNVFHLHHQVGCTTNPVDLNAPNFDAIASTADVTLTYHPRYLYLRGD